MHWGVFTISATHPLLYQNYLEEPQLPVRLVKEWILMLLIKKQLTWKLFIFWYLMSFFHKKMSQNLWAAIWASDSNILLAPKKKFGPAYGLASFQALQRISDKIIQNPIYADRHFTELMNYTPWSKSSRILLQHVSKWKVAVNYLLCICKHILYGLLIGFNKIFITKLKKFQAV